MNHQPPHNPDADANPANLDPANLNPQSDEAIWKRDTLWGAELETPDELEIAIRRAAALFQRGEGAEDGAISEDSVRRVADIEVVQRLSKRLDDEAIQIPESLGPLKLLECLGSGGMGQVYRAENPRLGRTQAVKVLHAHRLQSEEAVARFHQEIAAIGRLSHPNIVSAHHADEQDGIPYLVMEYVDGASLSQVMRTLRADGRQLSVGAAVNLVLQGAAGMQYAHQQGVLHRDLKPGNLLVDRQGIVRVSDLGLARLSSATPGDKSSDRAEELTKEGEVVGTLGFMPPEQIRDSKSVDERADVYSLGATLYFLLTGQEVYRTESKSTVARIASILHDPVPSVRSIRPDVPKELAQVLDRALAKNADDRIGSMQQLITLLSPWSGLPPADEIWADRSGAPEAVEKAQPRRRESRFWPPRLVHMLVGAGGLGLVAFLAGILLQLSLPDEGRLIIESSDEQLSVSVKQLDGAAVKSLEVKRGTNGPLHLLAGSWEVEIAGEAANNFRVLPDRVEVGADASTIVRIERKPVFAKPFSRGSAEVQASKATLPPIVDQLFDWRLRLLRPASGRLIAREHVRPCDLDPQGELIAWTTFDHAIVANRHSGKITQVFVPSDSQVVGWQAVQFSPSGEKVALISQYGANVEIRRRDGRLLSAWRNPQEVYATLEWLADEEHLLLTSESTLSVVDQQGKVRWNWNAPAGFTKILQSAMSRSDYESALFLTADGKLCKWHPPSATVSDVLAMDAWEPDQWGNFSESPDGSRILVAYGSSAPRTELRDAAGNRLAAFDTRILAVAWSPDRRYLVDSERRVRDAETLAVIRQLELPSTDPLVMSSLQPYWPADDEIILLSRHNSGWHSDIGAIRRFHPGGRQLSTPEYPQPLGPLSATFRADGGVSVYYGEAWTQAALLQWSAEGEPLRFQPTVPGSPDIYGVAWNSRDDRLLVPAGFMTMAMLSSEGQVIRQFDEVRTQAPTWSPDGKQFTLNSISEQRVHLYADGQVEPIWRSPRYEQISQPSWSPNGRWLAYRSSDSAGDKHRIHIVDMESLDRTIHDFDVAGHDERREEMLSAFADSEQLLTLQRRYELIENGSGEIVGRIRMPILPFVGQSNQKQTQHGPRLLWLGGMERSPQPLTGVGVIDQEKSQVLWTGIAFDDGAALAINAAGEILHSPKVIDRYITHTIRYPGGRSVPLTRDELHRRISATPDQKALLWASDLTAQMEGSDGRAITVDSSNLGESSAIETVQRLSLSRIQEIADRELTHLPRFTTLKQLDLSGNPISTLPQLAALHQLEELNLSNTLLADIDGLEGLRGLRKLDLSRTKITSAVAPLLGSLASVESLDLSYTDLDGFALLDLRRLTKLKDLKLAGLDLAEADLQQLRDALPNCTVVTNPSLSE